MAESILPGTTLKSYRSVPMAPVDAMSAAASFVADQWGEHGYRIGLAGTHHDDTADVPWYVFQCKAGDGSRFLVWSDRWGNTGTFSPERERAIALALDVETHA